MRHPFTKQIDEILKRYFVDDFEQIFKNSELLQYINIKNKISKQRVKSERKFWQFVCHLCSSRRLYFKWV